MHDEIAASNSKEKDYWLESWNNGGWDGGLWVQLLLGIQEVHRQWGAQSEVLNWFSFQPSSIPTPFHFFFLSSFQLRLFCFLTIWPALSYQANEIIKLDVAGGLMSRALASATWPHLTVPNHQVQLLINPSQMRGTGERKWMIVSAGFVASSPALVKYGSC